MTDADRMVVWLREAMDSARRDAEAATQGAWLPKRASNGWLIDIEGAAASQEYVVAGDGCGTPSCPGGGAIPNEADARFIAANGPAAVLRRIAADRKTLDDCDDVLHDFVFGAFRKLAEDTIHNLAEGWGWTEDVQR